MAKESSVARVYLLDAPYHIDKPYDYYIPEELRGSLTVGGLVAVPFGKGNRKKLALVSELVSASEYEKLKPVISPVCRDIKLDGEQIGLCFYMKEHFLCSVGDAVRAMIPSAALTRLKDYYSIVKPEKKEEDQAEEDREEETLSSLTPREKTLYLYLTAHGPTQEEKLLRDCGPSTPRILDKLTAAGILRRESRFIDARISTVEYAELTEEYQLPDEESLLRSVRGEKQKEALRALLLYGKTAVPELWKSCGVSRPTLTALANKKIVRLSTEAIYEDPYRSTEVVFHPIPDGLNEEQEAAKEQILSLCRLGTPQAALLHGVTGSGKTNVMLAVMKEVVEAGKSVILLVPEIALTPQTVRIFRTAFGDRAVVLHSGLTRRERWDAWRKIEAGEADLCIGTRSAIFAPFKNIGLIVLDEEQEHTYKSDMDPKYHARDVARYRCTKHNAVLLLASATPSIESFKKAKEGKYTLITLKKRYRDAPLPETFFADMREEARAGNTSPISAELKKRLEETLKRKEQAILFINQRGYSRFLSCPLCGEVLTCPHCSVSYTYHTSPKTGRGYLYCHYCGTKTPVPEKCPSCGNETLKRVGYGTQLVEDELDRLFPEAGISRMDADTTTTRAEYEEGIQRFRERCVDIMVGTQMITKGHDFPNVTLVGVIHADASLYLNDFRANERTFDLITQVVGRAGRGEKKGCALIQTFSPDHPVLRTAASQNYEEMYENEIALRRSLLFPPFCDLLLFTLSSEAENELMAAANSLAELINTVNSQKYPSLSVALFGPMEAPLYKINEIYRVRLVVKCRFGPMTRKMIAEIYTEFCRTVGGKITVSVDVNPSGL